MNRSQRNSIQRAISARVASIVEDRLPPLKNNSDPDRAIAVSLVNGVKVRLKSYADIRARALSKIVEERYSRTFELKDIFESSAEVLAEAKKAETYELRRGKLRSRLEAVAVRVLACADQGRFDTDTALALDEFEELAEKVTP